MDLKKKRKSRKESQRRNHWRGNMRPMSGLEYYNEEEARRGLRKFRKMHDEDVGPQAAV